MVLLSQNVSILDDLLSARSYADQGEALRALKNETVGHVMKKEKWVELGVLRPIVRVIMPERPTNWPAGDGRADRQDIRGAAHKRQSSSAQPVADLEADGLARLQALELLGIFASGTFCFWLGSSASRLCSDTLQVALHFSRRSMLPVLYTLSSPTLIP